MKKFTKEMLNKLTEANESVKGTSEYYKYYMECDCKRENGSWFFVGYYIPHGIGIIKSFKGNTYIIANNERYHVTDEVKNLLEI